MSSNINPSNLALFHNLSTKKLCSETTKPLSTRFKRRTLFAVAASSSASPSKQKSSDNKVKVCDVKFETLEGCKLGIARYPDFEYNAKGGIGTARVEETEEKGILPVSFDVAPLYIPPITGATTKFLGLPLPPFLKIAIVPELFQGTIGMESGKVELQFRAKFLFSVGSIYRAPPLLVETTLTSEDSKGAIREGRGERMDGQGRCMLVGVAAVDPINDVLMNSFLGLPTECIAVLKANISVSGFS